MNIKEIIKEVDERKEIAKIVSEDIKRLVRKTVEELLINIHEKILNEYKKRNLKPYLGEIYSINHQLVIRFLHEFLKVYTYLVASLNKDVEKTIEKMKKQLEENG